jgi:hypothetical protein
MKGYLYTLEMLIAVSIIFGSVIMVFSSPVDKPQVELNTIQQSCFGALKYLDEKGDLRKYASQGNESALESSLDSILAKSIGFRSKICQSSCYAPETPANETVIVIEYYISGYRQSYNATKVRLYAWKLK